MARSSSSPLPDTASWLTVTGTPTITATILPPSSRFFDAMQVVQSSRIAVVEGAMSRTINQSNVCMGSLQMFDNQLAQFENRVDNLDRGFRYLEGRVDEHGAEFRDLDDTLHDLRASINQVEGQVVDLGELTLRERELANDRIAILEHENAVQKRRMDRLEETIQRMIEVPAPQPQPRGDAMSVVILQRIQGLENIITGLVAETKAQLDLMTQSFVGEIRDWMEQQELDLPNSVALRLLTRAQLDANVDGRFASHFMRITHVQEGLNSAREDFLSLSRRLDAVELDDNPNKRARLENASGSTTAQSVDPIPEQGVHITFGVQQTGPPPSDHSIFGPPIRNII